MAQPSALASLVFALCLAGCGQHDGPEDTTVAALGTSLPMGAPNASGAHFEQPPVKIGGFAKPEDDLDEGPHEFPHPPPPDPFDGPHDDDGELDDHGGGAPTPHAPPPPAFKKKKGVAL